MNKLLQLRGQFEKRKNSSSFGQKNLPIGGSVSVRHLMDLRHQLQKILEFWHHETIIGGALLSVHYNHVVAKSNRIDGLLSMGSIKAMHSIRGSKFEGEDPHIKHVFTHFVSLDIINESINRLNSCIHTLDSNKQSSISHAEIKLLSEKKLLNEKKVQYDDTNLSLTNFVSVIVDAYYVERFGIDQNVEDMQEQAIVTIYQTNVKTSVLLSSLGIDMIDAKMIDETTVRLNPDELKILKNKAPYLISMQTYDISRIVKEDIEACDNMIASIPSPTNEPYVGVIDTLFYEDVYFKEWVTYTKMIDDNIPTDTQDCNHGTAVSSLIVDGPTINPDLDDGCGRFRVKHFGVAVKGRFSSFSILKAIREIIAKNQDVKVWNLSLGSVLEINRNFISPEAAELDKIQCEYDVIFVVAGTNKSGDQKTEMRIGAPADSINALVVNAVDLGNNPASYHRVGPVLSFFHKPDVSYYGGDSNEKIRVCTPFGEGFVAGTSFAVPWVSRKMAYLIHHMGFSREVAKALIIDSAAGWNRKDDATHSIGYGVVPRRIEDIVQSSDDEIRFIMTGSTDSYETYTYNIPIPASLDKHPFFARATLCYFTNCSRCQGVDYTNTEMDIHFGRVTEKEDKAGIKSINNNVQGNTGLNVLFEENARKLYRKWDNIKHISDTIKPGSRPRKKYGIGLWGLSIKTKERLKTSRDRSTPFGVVITLREMYGKNRIDDFIKLCMMRGWVVHSIDVYSRIDVYNKAEEIIEFEYL